MYSDICIVYEYCKNKRKLISQELNNSVVVGRAVTGITSAADADASKISKQAAKDFVAELRRPEESYWEQFSKPKEHSQEISESDEILNRKARADQSVTKQINLDLCFSRIGTLAMLARSILSGVFGSDRGNDPESTSTRKLDVLDDFLHKIRQQAQYSIHAQPGSGLRKPDDIASDMVENMVAASLGKKVYSLNAFVAPWLGLFKAFFPYSENPVWGLVPRMVDFCDNTAGKLTNIFWNIRRVGKAFVAYDGGISSEVFTEKQKQVREVISFYADRFLFNPNTLFLKPLKQIWDKVFGGSDLDGFRKRDDYSSHRQKEKIDTLTKVMMEDLKNNFKATFSKKYKCAHQGGKLKDIGVEEPYNAKWYVRLKMVSKWLGLPAGVIGSVLNGSGIALNFLGSLFNIGALRSMSDKATDLANGLMSLVYLTGEVPANLNEYFKKGELETDLNRTRNLAVFGVGFLGMLNRIKVLPIIGSIMNFVKLKPVLDRFDKTLSHFFLLFFSYNRLVMHSDEKREDLNQASVADVHEAQKHNNLRSHLLLPLRVLFGDDQVSEVKKLKDSWRQAA